MATRMNSVAVPRDTPGGAGRPPGAPRQAGYQELLGRIHSDLLNQLNLDRLTNVRREEAEPEIRDIVYDMLERESQTTPLSLLEREQLIVDVLNELFGLGPL